MAYEDGDGGGVCEPEGLGTRAGVRLGLTEGVADLLDALAELGEFVGEDVTGELEERASSEELEPESEVEIEEAEE